MRLGFHGGAGTVTGSRFLLDAGRTRLLVDCGLFQGLKELRLRNWRPNPFAAGSVDAVVLTHAHIDHSGYLPRLVREGFRGPIYATPATLELAEILLPDAARIQEEDAAYANRKGYSKHRPALPLFTEEDAQGALARMRAQPLDQPLTVGDLRVRFHEAGHILGSSFIEIEGERGDGGPLRIVFSGDLGRFEAPLHPDPAPLPGCDLLVLESTYGDRVHTSLSLEEQLRVPFAEALSRGGVVLIPAFAVARAQLVLQHLRRLIDAGELPRVPVHLDSPMAVDVTAIYRRHAGSASVEVERGDLSGSWVSFHRTVEESRALNRLKGPRIIIAASGMMTGGRVLHHLERLLPDRKNLVVLVGYQAAGTRGRKLQEGARFLRMHGVDVPVRARYLEVEGLSAHADVNDLLRWLDSAPRPPRAVFLTHGEPQALAALAGRLEARGLSALIPALNQEFDLDALLDSRHH
jgi:metallo-beta-lactamase family protein